MKKILAFLSMLVCGLNAYSQNEKPAQATIDASVKEINAELQVHGLVSYQSFSPYNNSGSEVQTIEKEFVIAAQNIGCEMVLFDVSRFIADFPGTAEQKKIGNENIRGAHFIHIPLAKLDPKKIDTVWRPNQFKTPNVRFVNAPWVVRLFGINGEKVISVNNATAKRAPLIQLIIGEHSIIEEYDLFLDTEASAVKVANTLKAATQTCHQQSADISPAKLSEESEYEAATYTDAAKLFTQGKTDHAVMLLQVLAGNDRFAAYALGEMYALGEYVGKDLDEAKLLLESACDSNVITACRHLKHWPALANEKVMTSFGVKAASPPVRIAPTKEYREAISMYFSNPANPEGLKRLNELAAKGDRGAAYTLGELYLYGGKGVQKDEQKALELMDRACDDGAGVPIACMVTRAAVEAQESGTHCRSR